jgi:hypothetical protein
VRLAVSPRRNHWWNVPFHLTGCGITTRPMGRDPIFAIDFDFIDHRLHVATTAGDRRSFALPGLSVATFAARLEQCMSGVGVPFDVGRLRPYDLPDASRPFVDDGEHASYDPAAVTRYWRILSQVNLLLEEFAARWSGKTSPVHHFWHTFDIAVTRFSDRHVEQGVNVDPVTREAYSRAVISFGFWFGDPTFTEPAFYSYTAPEPDGLDQEPLRPADASWLERNGSHLALLRYDAVRKSADPHGDVLDFYESAFRAGARRAGWDTSAQDCPGGVTDPQRSAPST